MDASIIRIGPRGMPYRPVRMSRVKCFTRLLIFHCLVRCPACRSGGWSVFQQSMPSDLIRGWKPVRAKKTGQIKNLGPGSDSIGTQTALVAVVTWTGFGQFAKHLDVQHHDGAMLQANPVARSP